jgi:hypothetical protein
MSEEYLGIEKGMPVTAILLSTSQAFSSLAALTNVLVPDAACWVGDYPYMNRPEVEALQAGDDELRNVLQAQGYGYSHEDRDDVNDDGEMDNDYRDNLEKVQIRRRKY